MTNNKPITIRDLYPDMSEDELAVAEANLRRYVASIVRIYERIRAEGGSWPAPGIGSNLTTSGNHPSIPHERSNSSKRN